MNTEAKTCLRCGRIMEYRKKWEKNWDSVKYCSDACRANKKQIDYRPKILELLVQRGRDKTICPSEVLNELDKKDKQKMEDVRASARLLVTEGKIVITQKGNVVDPSRAKGAIRLKLK